MQDKLYESNIECDHAYVSESHAIEFNSNICDILFGIALWQLYYQEQFRTFSPNWHDCVLVVIIRRSHA